MSKQNPQQREYQQQQEQQQAQHQNQHQGQQQNQPHSSPHDPQRNTKDQIEQTALQLFAQKGYTAVSIRDIGKLVGIKESSIYYHFKSKQAILDSILDKITLLIEEMKQSFGAAFSQINEVPEEAMCQVAVGMLDQYLLHPVVHTTIAMLSIERMSDAKAYDTYQRLVFELPLAQQEQVFAQMMERGYIRPNNPSLLAQQYYAVIYLAYQKNCLGCNATEAGAAAARQEIRDNIRDLYQKMR